MAFPLNILPGVNGQRTAGIIIEHETLHALTVLTFNSIPTRVGGGGGLCPLPGPQVHFLRYLKNALSYGLETF